MRKLLLILCLACPSLAAADGAKPPELETFIEAAQPVGTASLSKLLLHVYDASYWSEQATWPSEEPYALSITYAMNFTPDELADRTLDEMKRVSPLPPGKLSGYADKLRGLYPQVKEGDRITALFLPPSKTVLYHNGKKFGLINDKGFVAAFFGIWLSEKTSEPKLRAGLLGLK